MKLHDRASFYQKLHSELQCGLSLHQMLEAGLLPPEYADANIRLQQEVSKGSSIANTFTIAGLVLDWEAQFITIGETSGNLAAVLLRLNQFFTQKVSQLGHIKSKLVDPFLTLLIAIPVLPIPALVSGALSITRYVMQSGVSVLLLFFIYK